MIWAQFCGRSMKTWTQICKHCTVHQLSENTKTEIIYCKKTCLVLIPAGRYLCKSGRAQGSSGRVQQDSRGRAQRPQEYAGLLTLCCVSCSDPLVRQRHQCHLGRPHPEHLHRHQDARPPHDHLHRHRLHVHGYVLRMLWAYIVYVSMGTYCISSEPTSSTCPLSMGTYYVCSEPTSSTCPWVRITYALSLHRLRVHGYVLRIVWAYIVYVSTVHGYQGWGNRTRESYSCVIVGHFRGIVLVLNYICQKDKVIVLVLDYFVKVIVLMIPFTITWKKNVFLIRIIRFCW